MLSSGFSWGLRPEKSSNDGNDMSSSNHPRPSSTPLPPAPRSVNKMKRKFDIDNDEAYMKKSTLKPRSKLERLKINKKASSQPSTSNVISSSQYSLPQPSASNSPSSKKLKTPNIVGQPLPISRIIEVLDKKNLQHLLLNLVQTHPEITQDFINLSPKPNVHDSLSILEKKFTDIESNLPYKCDMESDYSYNRIKPWLNEFFQCLSDFILNYLPPVESNLTNSLEFLEGITLMIHKLPGFNNREFHYNRLVAYEQISNTWFIIIKSFLIKSPTPNLMYLINNNYLKKLENHSELSVGDHFTKILDFLHCEIEISNNSSNNATSTNNSSTSSSSNKFQDNFSLNNNPLVGSFKSEGL